MSVRLLTPLLTPWDRLPRYWEAEAAAAARQQKGKAP